MQYCYHTDNYTNCPERCRECAKDEYAKLKEMAGKAEFVTEEAIRNELGNGAFKLLKEFKHIEFCGIVNNTRMYAI